MLEMEDLAGRCMSASAALDRGEIPRARRDFEMLVLDAPFFAPAWDGLARCHEAEGSLQQAGECFRKAMRLDRQAWLPRYNWGMALLRAGNPGQAVRWLREAGKMAADERQPLLQLGHALTELGDLKRAAQALREALQRPERTVRDAQLWVALGNVELRQGDIRACEEAFQRACLLAPDDPQVYYHWARATAEQDDLTNALRLAVRCRALDHHSLRSALLPFTLALDGELWDTAESHLAVIAGMAETERLVQALRAELRRRQGDNSAARELALQVLREGGQDTEHAVDRALTTLRLLRGDRRRCRSFRMLVEVRRGEQAYYRPYLVSAESETAARAAIADIQDALDCAEWDIIETDRYPGEQETLSGVYGVSLSRKLFSR